MTERVLEFSLDGIAFEETSTEVRTSFQDGGPFQFNTTITHEGIIIDVLSLEHDGAVVESWARSWDEFFVGV